MKKITFLIIFFLSFITGVNAQVELGGGTATVFPSPAPPSSPTAIGSVNLPIYCSDSTATAYTYTYSQSIYLASEINTSGNITSLKWYYAGGNNPLKNSQNISIYMGHTAKTAFYYLNSGSDVVPSTNLTAVYTGPIPVTGSGWITLNFSTPFNYNGTDNLVVATAENMKGGDKSVGFYNTIYSTNRSLSFVSGLGAIDITNPVVNTHFVAENAAPDVIFGGITQSCPTPVELAASNITATSAQINWPEANAPGGTYEYYLGTTSQVPYTNTPFKGPATMPLNLTSLKPGTTYNLWVRRICGSSKSNISFQQFSFTTACGNVTDFVQKFDNFNTLPSPSYPQTTPATETPCWQQVGSTGTAKIQPDTLNGNVGQITSLTAPNALSMVSNSTSSQAIVAMPQVTNANDGTHVLRFQARAESASRLNGTIDVGYFTDTTPSSTSFVKVSSITVTSTNYAEFIVPIGNAPGASAYLGFRHTGSPANIVYIDNVYWEVGTGCSLPTALSVSNIKPTSATISFNPPSTAPLNGYEYYISTMSEEPVAATVASGQVVANSTSFNIPNLNPSTTYYVWMRSVCDATSSSWYDIPAIFTTSCASTSVPWTDGFESLNVVGLNIFPGCWNYTNVTSTWNSTTGATTTIKPHYGNNYMSVSTGVFEGWAFTPLLHLTAGTKYTYSYSVISSPTVGQSTGYNITLKVGNAQAPANMLETIKSETGLVFSNWTRKTFEYTVPVTGDYSFGLDVQPNGTIISGINFDDFSVIATPSCDAEPTAISVQAEDVTDTTAIVTWQQASTPATAGYEYYLSTTQLYPLATVTPYGSVATGNFANITALTPGTTYYIWVRSACGTQPTDKGTWSEFASFVTKCSDATTLTENFDSANVFPICFRVLTGSSKIFSIPDSPAPSLPNSILINSNSIVALPPFSNLTAGTNRLLFKARGISDGVKFEIGYLTDVNDPSTYASFSPPQIYTLGLSNVFGDYQITPTGLPAGVKYLAFNTKSAINGIAIDNVSWSLAPTCLEPTALVTSNTTDTSTYLQWTASGSAPSTYEYYVSTSNATPATNVTATGSVSGSTGTSLQNLSSGTTYYVWVRGVCDSYDGANWSVPATFNTICAQASEFQQNFDGATSLPGCWTKISLPGGSGTVHVQAYPKGGAATSAPNALLLSSNKPTIDGVGMIGMPPINNSGDGTHRLRFNTLLFAPSTTAGTLDVGYMHDPTDPSSFTLLATYLVTSTTPANVIMSFGVNQSISPYLAFRNNATVSSHDILIDDVFWETIPPCVEPTAITVSNVLSTTATVSWTAATTDPANGYEYYLSTTATPPATTATATAAVLPMGATTLNLTGLTPHSNYYIWVRSNCGDSTAKSAWVAATLNTLCSPLLTPPYDQDFSNYAGPNSICWTGAKDGYLTTGITTNGPTNFTNGNFLNAAATDADRCVKVLIQGSNNISWILSPVFDLSATNYVLSFDYGLTDYGSKNGTQLGTDDVVSVAMLVDGKLPWISLADYTAATVILPTSQTATFVNFNPRSKSVQFAFYETSGQTFDGSASEFFIDNFKLEVSLDSQTFSDESFSSYPNPVKDILNLSYNKNITSVNVCNVLGQEVLTKALNANQGQIDMSNLTSGIYLVKVTADNQIKTIKIIKE